jgi:hypothetical protein
MHSSASSALVRCAAKLGLKRRAKQVEDMDSYLAKRKKQKHIAAALSSPEPEEAVE